MTSLAFTEIASQLVDGIQAIVNVVVDQKPDPIRTVALGNGHAKF